MRGLHRVEDAAREVRLDLVLLYHISVVAADGVEEGEVGHLLSFARSAALCCWRLQQYSGVGGAEFVSVAQLDGAGSEEPFYVIAHCQLD